MHAGRSIFAPQRRVGVRKHVLAASCLLALICCVSVLIAAWAVPVTYTAAETEALRTAMAQGNAKVVVRAARTMGMDSRWIALYQDQLRYRMPQLLARAQGCRHDMMHGKRAAGVSEATAMAGAIACEQFIIEATKAMGDAHGYLAAFAWQQSHGAEAWAQAFPNRDVHFPSSATKAAELADAVPPFSVQMQSTHPVALPYVKSNPNAKSPGTSGKTRPRASARRSAGAFRPEVEVVINGHKVKALVDTGSDVPLTVSYAYARAFGLLPLITGMSGLRYLGAQPVTRGSEAWYMASKLDFGPLRMYNVMTTVISGHYHHTGVTIGLPVLAHFNEVVFNRFGMIVNAAARLCRHDIPVTYAASPGNGGFLVFPAEAAGMPVRAMIDTGSDGAVVVGPRLMPKHMFSATGSSVQSLSRHFRYIEIRLAGFGRMGIRALMLAGMPKNVDIDFGFPPSWGWKAVSFDFGNMSICLVPGLNTKRLFTRTAHDGTKSKGDSR